MAENTDASGLDAQYITVNELSLRVDRWGNGPEHILLCHGWISSRRMFDEVVARLDRRRYTLHVMDFHGCGLSDRRATGHDVGGYAADLQAVIASIKHEITIVAHSMGARVALAVAATRPASLRRLILLAPGSPQPVRPSSKHRALAEAAFGSRARLRPFIAGSMAAAIQPAILDRLVGEALIAQYEHWFGWYDDGRLTDLSPCLADIYVPTLIIGGLSDPLVRPAMLKGILAPGIRGASLVMLKNVGHNLPI